MSNNQLKDQMKELLWQLIEKHYNVDRQQPQILTSKKLLVGFNPIDQIGEQLADVVEKLVLANLDPKEEAKDDSDGTDDDDSTDEPDPWGYYNGGD